MRNLMITLYFVVFIIIAWAGYRCVHVWKGTFAVVDKETNNMSYTAAKEQWGNRYVPNMDYYKETYIGYTIEPHFFRDNILSKSILSVKYIKKSKD